MPWGAGAASVAGLPLPAAAAAPSSAHQLLQPGAIVVPGLGRGDEHDAVAARERGACEPRYRKAAFGAGRVV